MASTAIVPNEDYSVDHDPAAKGFRLKGDEINPGANMVYGTDGAGTKGWQSASAADGSETQINAGANVTVTGTGTIGDPYVIAASGGGGATLAQDNLSDGPATFDVDRLGGSAATLNSPSGGEFDITIPAGAYAQRISAYNNSNALNASQEMVIRVDNSANSRDRKFVVQLYDANNDALVDQQITSTVHTQATAGNITTITIPGLNGFGTTGFRVELS